MLLPANFDVARALAFLKARAIPGLEVVTESSYGRAITMQGRHHWLGCEFRGGRVDGSAVPQIRRIFDLDTDLEPFLRMARRDRILAPLVRRRPGLRRPLLLDPFETAVRAIAGQLISVTAATILVARLVERCGPRFGRTRRAFPGPSHLLRNQARIGPLGFPKSKVAAILGIAEACHSGRLDWDFLAADPAAADVTLRAFTGIGPWTSAYIRWRGLGDLDAFPETDLGIRRAMSQSGVEPAQIRSRGEQWKPWRGLAVGHLWASLTD